MGTRPAPSPAVLAAIFGEDTSPDVAMRLLEAYRRMSGTEKIDRMRALNRAALALTTANIREMHPHADEREVLLRLAVRRYGADFARERLGWDVRKEGY